MAKSVSTLHRTHSAAALEFSLFILVTFIGVRLLETMTLFGLFRCDNPNYFHHWCHGLISVHGLAENSLALRLLDVDFPRTFPYRFNGQRT